MRKTLTRTGAVGLTIGVTMTVGIAFAAWTSTGSGSGTAQSTTSANSVIAAAASAADLFPGAVKSVTVTISNPNDYPVKVTSISAGSSNVVDKGTPADSTDDCAAATVTSDGKTEAGGVPQSNDAINIAPKGSGTYTLVTRMVADPSDNCKSTTFTLPLSANLVSAAS